jgi:hypothetical protein
VAKIKPETKESRKPWSGVARMAKKKLKGDAVKKSAVLNDLHTAVVNGRVVCVCD